MLLYGSAGLFKIMRQKISVCFFLLLVSGPAVFSQALLSDQTGMIYFNKQDYGRMAVELDKKMIDTFGDTVAYLVAVFESNYVTIIKNSGAYSVDEERILKPVIYKKVRYLGKKYLSAKGETASNKVKFKKVLMKAIDLASKDTSRLEEKLKGAKKVEEIEQLFLTELSP